MEIRNSATAPLVLLLALACGDSTGISAEKLAGTWTATEFVFTNQANLSQSVDWIPLGASFTLTIRADSTFTTTLREPGGVVDTDTGIISVAGNVLTIAESGQGSPTPFTAVRDGDVLTLTTTDADFDFDGDGTDEPASLRIVLRRS